MLKCCDDPLNPQAKLDVKNIFGENLIHMWADEYERAAMLLPLLKNAGLDINARNYNDATPLLLAVGNLNYFKVKALLNEGADPNLRDKQGVSPLSFVQSKAIQDYLATRKKKHRKRAQKIVDILTPVTTVKGAEFVKGSIPPKDVQFADVIEANKKKTEDNGKNNNLEEEAKSKPSNLGTQGGIIKPKAPSSPRIVIKKGADQQLIDAVREEYFDEEWIVLILAVNCPSEGARAQAKKILLKRHKADEFSGADNILREFARIPPCGRR